MFFKTDHRPPFSQHCFIVLIVRGIYFGICCPAVLCGRYVLPTSHFLESVNLVLYLPKHKLAHKRNCLKYLLSGQTLPYALRPSLACVCCLVGNVGLCWLRDIFSSFLPHFPKIIWSAHSASDLAQYFKKGFPMWTQFGVFTTQKKMHW